MDKNIIIAPELEKKSISVLSDEFCEELKVKVKLKLKVN